MLKAKSLPSMFLSLMVLLAACSSLTPSQVSTPAGLSDPAPQNTQPMTVNAVEVLVGIGSPLPVEIVVSGTWPSLCSQIADIKSSIDGFQIDISLLASMADSCPPDNVGLSYRFAIPLNVVELKEGTYTITVNGVSTTLDLPADLSKGTGAIFGWVWEDQCTNGQDGQQAPGCVDEISPIGPSHGNGIREPNEQPIEGVTVRLFKGNCGSDSLTQIAETQTIASDISYSFTGLPAGSYCVYIGQQEDVNRPVLGQGMWTYPTVSARDIQQTVNLGPGEGVYNVDFGWDYQLK